MWTYLNNCEVTAMESSQGEESRRKSRHETRARPSAQIRVTRSPVARRLSANLSDGTSTQPEVWR